MADTRQYVQGQDYQLAGSGCSATATSITLTSFNYPNGDAISMSDFGTLGLIVLEPETEREENASFTGLTTNANGTITLTGVTRGLKFKSPYDQDLALRFAHAGGSTVRISNSAPFYNNFANKENNETISQVWTFGSSATPLITDQPTTNTQAANKLYVDSVAIAGAPDASDVTKGITKLSVAAVAPTNPIAVGDNDGRVPTQSENDALAGNGGSPSSTNTFVTQQGFQEGSEIYAASSGGTDAYSITLSPPLGGYVDGMTICFKADVANIGASTLNAGPGAKAIVKGVSTPTETNDIAAGGIICVKYQASNDNLQMQTPSARPAIYNDLLTTKGDMIAATGASSPARLAVGADGTGLRAASGEASGVKWQVPYATGQSSRATGDGTGDQVITHSLGLTPTFIEITCFGSDEGNPQSIGTATSASDETVTYFIPTAAGADTAAQAANEIIHIETSGGGGGVAGIAQLTAVSSTTFTINWTTNALFTKYFQWKAFA